MYYFDVVKFSKPNRSMMIKEKKKKINKLETFGFVFESTCAAQTFPKPDLPIKSIKNPIAS
jgi:hypothetical protein